MPLGLFFSAFGMGDLPVASAQEKAADTPTPEVQVEVTVTPEPIVSPAPETLTEAAATPTSEVEDQIIGGTEADPGEYPWQVALVDGSSTNLYLGQFCGGSLIDPEWVLTAAHCITESNGSVSLPSYVDIVAGIWNLESPDPGYQRRNVTQIIRHPSYNANTFDSDVALLKLETPVTIGGSGSTKTAVIPLVPSSIGSLAGSYTWISGWGYTESSVYPTQLREVQLPIMPASTCNNYRHWGGQITGNMLCAGYDPGGAQSACYGDSGGPAVVWNSSTGQWNLAGVVSFGPLGCAVPYAPSVFARVSQFGSWVNNYIIDSPVLTYPAQGQNIGTNYDPIYIWNKVDGVTHYHFYVSGPSGFVLDQWFEASSICDTTTCSVTLGPSATLMGGNYSWYVQTWNPVGYGPWSNNSQPTNFSAAVPTTPAAATLTYPAHGQNIGTDFTPIYQWNKVDAATWYHLYVGGPSGKVLDQWYQASSVCGASTCSINPGTTLGVGNHSWYIQTYNSAGYGPWSNNTQPTNFNTIATSTPGAPNLTYPAQGQNIGETYNPTYQWSKVNTATWYHVSVGGPSGTVLDQWYQASSTCDASTCSVTPTVTLGGGNYSWYVQAWNPAGFGPWSNNAQPTNFITTVPSAPGAATLTYPAHGQNIGTDFTPIYQWNKVDAATWYHVYVGGPGGKVLDQWYQASSVCGASTCSINPSATLGIGNYSWYVQTYGTGGYGPWSNNTQPTNFNTTTTSVPGLPTLTYPANMQQIGTDYTPTYQWNKLSTATWYRVYVTGPGGLVLDQWYQASSVCGASVCSTTPTVTLAGGGTHFWYVQAWNPAGSGPWSNPTNFSTAVQSVPTGAVLTAPTGTIASQTPTYTWNRVNMATWYRLYVKGPGGVVKDQWYQAVSTCNASTCSVPSPTLGSGDHTWWVQSYNSAGYGPWTVATFKVSP